MASIAEQIEQAEAELASIQEQVKADLANLRERLGLNSSPQLFSSTATTPMNISTSKPKAKTNGNGASKQRGSKQRRRRQAAASGQRKEQFLEEVQRVPGITVAEIGERFGVDPTGLYRYAKSFEADGKIRKDGKQLFPVEKGPLTASDLEVPETA